MVALLCTCPRPLQSAQKWTALCCPKQCRVWGLCKEGERVKDISSGSPSVSPPLTSITSMNLLRIAIFKRPPSFPPADKTVIILHLHDKCVCLCTHLCMYVWVLKRTLAAVGHEFLSFISASKTKRGLFLNVETGSLSLCSSSECSSLATVSPRALKWSQGLVRDVE